jgi:hypothetical protein
MQLTTRLAGLLLQECESNPHKCPRTQTTWNAIVIELGYSLTYALTNRRRFFWHAPCLRSNRGQERGSTPEVR